MSLPPRPSTAGMFRNPCVCTTAGRSRGTRLQLLVHTHYLKQCQCLAYAVGQANTRSDIDYCVHGFIGLADRTTGIFMQSNDPRFEGPLGYFLIGRGVNTTGLGSSIVACEQACAAREPPPANLQHAVQIGAASENPTRSKVVWDTFRRPKPLP